MMKNGLVLEGGAMRGMFTAGVTDVLMEEGIRFDGMAGISAGAVFGCNVKSGQIGRTIRYNKKYSKDPRFASLRSWITTGDYFGVDFCYRRIPQELDPFDQKAFQENPMEFYVGATDVKTGECLFHKCVDGGEVDTKWMQASASMPLVSHPVAIDGHLLLDGGIVCSVPYQVMEENGYDHNVIILTRPASYVKKKTTIPGWFFRKYPEIRKAMLVRHEAYARQMEEIAEREKAGRAFVIRPEEDLGISRTEKDPTELERVYQAGRDVATKKLMEIKEFISVGVTISD